MVLLVLSASTQSGLGNVSSVTFEAESGALGANFTNGTSSGVQFISISTDRINNGNPGNSSRVATYTVTFPAPGNYHLYARVRVGSDTFNDDSLFYGNGFGAKAPNVDGHWITVNGLGSAGFNNNSDVVTGGGSLGNNVWKWINLSLFSGQSGFNVSAGALTQTFQIGAREDGLDFDKFVFGRSDYIFTVADLNSGGPGTLPSSSVSIDATRFFQTIEGLGGAIAFYNGWITAHPYKQEIISNAFSGLNISMLRLGNWYRYQNTLNFDPPTTEIVATANQLLGRQVPILMSSWAPPAFLKSNGQVGNGGTLIFTNGGFAYNEFGKYWYDSLRAYRSNGISPTWISIQNEPDWEASYDSCIFRPTEGVVNGTNYASYSKALDATYQWVTNLSSPPKFLAPEPVGIGYNVIQNYAPTLNPNHFYGVAYHLYHGSSDGSANGYINSLRATTNLFPTKPRFMTEFGVSNMVESATLIHNVLVEGNASGYNHWSLIWPGPDGGLVQIEFPWDQSTWTNAPAGSPTQSRGYWLSPSYWAMKHFSYFVPAGSRRIATTSTDANVKFSAYMTPDNLRVVGVIINRKTDSVAMDLNFSSFGFGLSSVYQTAGTNHFKHIGSADTQLILPAESLTTVVLDKLIAVGQAENPLPANGETGVAFNSTLSWTSGSNALTHLLFVGTSSNAVALATTASQEFRGVMSSNSFNPVLAGGITYFWRVDSVAGANTNIGEVWSFTTAPLPALVHRYSFDETGGTTFADLIGGPVWDGTVFNGGTLSGGLLSLGSGSQQHAALPAGIVSALTNFTIETWVRLNAISAWSRIFDFGTGSTVNMFLTPLSGTGGTLRFAMTINGAGGEQRINAPSALTPGVWHHVAVTLNGNIGVLYLNGNPVATNTSITLRPWNMGATPNNYLGRSQYSDPYLNGAFNEFRIYSVALSRNEIAASYAMGPGRVFSDDSPLIAFTPGASSITLSWPLEATSFRLQSRTNLTQGAWMNVASPVPQLVNGQWQVTVPVQSSGEAMFYRLTK